MSAAQDSQEGTALIGARLTALRTARNMRISELARRAAVSPSLISQIERGHSRPSVGTLFTIAQILEVPVDSFLTAGDEEPGVLETSAVPAEPGNDAGGDPYVLRGDARPAVNVRGGVRWERLTPTALDGVEFMDLVYAPGAESDSQLYRHPGIELVRVLEGTMTIFLGFERYDLQAGDSIAFPSSTPHRYTNLTDRTARAVTVILRDDLSSLPLGSERPSGGET